MSTKSDYSDAEWKAVSAAPVAAGLLITLSDASGPVGIAKEAVAVSKAISESALGDAPEIVKTVAESVKTGAGRPELPAMPSGGRAQMKDALMGVIKNAVGALQTKSPLEVERYKTWLVSIATKVSQASKEGGTPGHGRYARERRRAGRAHATGERTRREHVAWRRAFLRAQSQKNTSGEFF